MTIKQVETEFIEPWINEQFLSETIGKIAYDGILKDLAAKFTELENAVSEAKTRRLT